MRDVKCYVKVAPTVHRKDEAEFLNHYDAPFAASNDQTDKQNQPLKKVHTKKQLARKRGAQAKSEIYKPSSPSQVWQKKVTSTRPLEEHDEESIEKSIKPLEKPVEINIPSSTSQVWRKKVISTVPLEEPSQQFTRHPEELKEESIQENIRPSEEPNEESIEKSTKSSEEFDEESIEKSINTLFEECDEESIEKSIITLLEESDEESIEKSISTLFEESDEESIEKSIIRLFEELDTTPSKESDEGSAGESVEPSQEPDEESVVESHVHYIRREGFGKANQEVGWMCGFCEKDLAIAPFREEEEPQPFPKEEFYWEFFLQQEEERLESSLLLPEVCIFPCGHALHSLCLQIAQLEEHLSDAPCPICITLS